MDLKTELLCLLRELPSKNKDNLSLSGKQAYILLFLREFCIYIFETSKMFKKKGRSFFLMVKSRTKL